jgi:hypothetical protein
MGKRGFDDGGNCEARGSGVLKHKE